MATSRRAKYPLLIGRKRGLGIVLILALALLFVQGCKREEKIMLEKLLHTEPGRDETRIADLERDIKLLLAEVKRTVGATEKLGTYYRMLAVEFMDRDMFGPALENFRKAIEIYPGNHQLSYYAGVCASLLAKAEARAKEKEQLFEEARQHYLQALRLRPNFGEVLYALSVLYIFEMEMPLAAEPLLITLLSQDPEHVQGLFLMARLKVLSGGIEEAVDLYDRIIKVSEDKEEQEKARENRQALLEGAYER